MLGVYFCAAWFQTSAGEPLSNCTTTDKTTIKCYLSPDYGNYMIYLKHIAPWIGGIFYRQESVSQEICKYKPNLLVGGDVSNTHITSHNITHTFNTQTHTMHRYFIRFSELHIPHTTLFKEK